MAISDTLLMFSGGLDSTGVFWKLIQEKSIYVHHMNLINQEKRTKAESKAVKDILNYMNKIKPSIYSESTHEYPSFNNKFIWDSDIASFIAGNICAALPNIKFVAIGMTASDGRNSLPERMERANKIFSALCNAKKIFPVIEMSKKQIYDMLPNDLRTLTWSCRKPTYNKGMPVACNKCIPCKDIKEFCGQNDK